MTFFFRQMPELIEGGYVYIAQPPLYKVSRGKSETYLKDDPALEAYLISAAVDDLTYTDANGAGRSGADLRSLLEMAGKFRPSIDAIARKCGCVMLVELAACAGAFAETPSQALADVIAARLDAREIEKERGWKGEYTEVGGYVLTRSLRGVTETLRLSADHIRSAEAKRLDGMKAHLSENYGGAGALTGKDGKAVATVHGPLELLDAVLANGRKGLSIQRYKGLGEMNPEQLWETTLDPEARTLLQVNIKDAEKANELFSTLMGDVVEPRREFIQDNALKAEVDA